MIKTTFANVVLQNLFAKKQKKEVNILQIQKISRTFAIAKPNKVPWMSGLVSGLQNRVRRFESARNLKTKKMVR